MNYKLEKFWNSIKNIFIDVITSMNYKLEKFWNIGLELYLTFYDLMNYKLEKFWNSSANSSLKSSKLYEL